MNEPGGRSVIGEHRIGLGRLTFASLGGAVAWTLDLTVGYFLVAVGCNTGWAGTDAALGVATAVFAAMAAASGWVAYREWRRLGRSTDWLSALDDPGGRTTLFLIVGMGGAGIFLLLILLMLLPPFFVPTCT